MSIWGIKLSTWIRKDDPKCDYKSHIKFFQHYKCVKKCGRKAGYGMWDLHSAPQGMGDGPFCSQKCMNSYRHENLRPKSKIAKKKCLLRRTSMVCMVLRLGHTTGSSRDHLLRTYGVTEEQVIEFQKRRPDNPKNHAKCEKKFEINFKKKYS